jgi:hypothetical protein
MEPDSEDTRELYDFGTLQPAVEILDRIRNAVARDQLLPLRIIVGVVTDERGGSLITGVPTPVMQQVTRIPKLTEVPPLATQILEAPAAVREIVFANLVAIVANSLRDS